MKDIRYSIYYFLWLYSDPLLCIFSICIGENNSNNLSSTVFHSIASINSTGIIRRKNICYETKNAEVISSSQALCFEHCAKFMEYIGDGKTWICRNPQESETWEMFYSVLNTNQLCNFILHSFDVPFYGSEHFYLQILYETLSALYPGRLLKKYRLSNSI